MTSISFVYPIQLKELEKLGPKKGVITQSVKDVVQSLVDDDLVLKDKIGTSVSECILMKLQIGICLLFGALLLTREEFLISHIQFVNSIVTYYFSPST